MNEFYTEIIEMLKKASITKYDLNKLKNKLAKKYHLKKIPTDAEILLHADNEDYKKLKLVTKPTRTLSGVAPIALMCKPHKCPHGTCFYCPGGPGSEFGDVPQSYTGNEPSTMRSMRNHYDPYLIIFNRLEQFVILNQNPEKTEIIIQGGTFLSLDKKYKDEFVMYIFKALNDFSDLFYKQDFFDFEKFKDFYELPGIMGDPKRTLNIHAKLQKLKGKSNLKKEQTKNETSKIRCVGLTIETKPDWGLAKQGIEMLQYGCTRVELGVQSTNDKILKFINRGHDNSTIIESTKNLKDLGFKINYHMMPGLPLSNPKNDLKDLIKTIENSDYRPDMYKMYPTMVMKGTGLFKLMKNNKYSPITTEIAADIISDFKEHVPYWVRIMRVQRDIPTNVTEAGVDKTNLRQYVEKKLKEKNIVCNCIRCREAGLASRKHKIKSSELKMFIDEYDASNGKEFFITFEDKNRKNLFGYCRLRFPSEFLTDEITTNSALIRELHVVGTAAGIGDEGNIQHKGLGNKLLKKAEEISNQHGKIC